MIAAGQIWISTAGNLFQITDIFEGNRVMVQRIGYVENGLRVNTRIDVHCFHLDAFKAMEQYQPKR